MDGQGTRNILLVEDEAVVALQTKELLEEHGFAVSSVHNAADAVAAVASGHFDLILMDIDLGSRRPDGTETAARILADRHIPIVFLTNHGDKETVEKVRGITRYGYVLKNSGEFVLLQAIETAFELRRVYLSLEEEARRRRESEERYRLIVQHAEEAITLFDLDDRVLLMNEKAAANLGGKPQDFAGKRPADFLPEAEAARAAEGLHRVAESGESSITEWEVPVPDGPRWFRSRIHPVIDDRGELFSVLSSSLDITEQVRSAKLYELVVEHMSDVVAAYDSEFRLTYLSPSAERLFGYSIEDFSRRSIFDVVHEEDRRELQVGFQKAIAKGERFHVARYRVTRKDGELVSAESRVTFLYNESGEFERMIAVVRDISETVAAEKALTEAERFARTVADTVPALVYVHDFASGRNTWANKAHREFFRHVNDGEIKGAEQEAILRVIHPDDHKALFDQLGRTVADRPDLEDAILLRCWNGESWVWFLHRHVVLDADDGGKPKAVVGILTSVDDLKHREAKANEALAKRDVLWQEINHRVKNNLALVSSLLSFHEQAKGVDLSAARGQIEAIANVHHLLTEEAASGTVDLQTHARAVIDSLTTTGAAGSVELHASRVDLDARDAVMVGIILNELVTNAIKHGSSASAEDRVAVTLTVDGEDLRISVSNGGPALPKDFDPRAAAGLGLQLVQALAEQGRGTLEVRRNPRTEFLVTIALSGP